jgi:16S rRNA (adenine1518-N6/adenine1519-N6)-dimethyltransferase
VSRAERVNPNALQVRRLLQQSGVKARKSLGQNFLIDSSILKMIVDAAELTLADTVIEVGPGLGVLTEQLAAHAGNVISIELDDALFSYLQKKFAGKSQVTIIHEDVLKTDISQLAEKKKEYKVVANLPYSITSPVLHHFINANLKPQMMVVMVQKEVAENITAGPDDMSALAIGLRIYASSKIIGLVPAASFYPVPKVDSAVIRFDFFSKPAVEVDNIDKFLDVVRCGFRSPRKQIRNSLATGLKIDTLRAEYLLEKAKIDIQLRPQALGMEDWQRLYNVVKTEGSIPEKC